MWLYRGAQSAVFYYATCTPCMNSMDRRKRKKDAARTRRYQEKADALVTDQPRPFAQPTPFSTNEGWNQEIALGPGPPAKRGGTRRRAGSWNADTFSASSVPSNRDLDGGDTEAPKKDKTKNPLGERWNWMRYQREDEPLWGMNAEARGSSVGIAGVGDLDPNPSKYYIARVPPVNDLHPPIVSGPKSRAETRWMLQPPPSAKVMAGKERFSSGRGNTRMTSDEDVSGMQGESSSSGSSSNRKSASPNTHSSSSPNRGTNKPHTRPPITTSTSDYTQRTSTYIETNLQHPRPPLPTLSTNIAKQLAVARDESSFVILPPGESRPSSVSTVSSSDSESKSPGTPWQFPDSKPANKMQRSDPQATLSALAGDDSKDIHLLHLEINEDGHDDVDLGKLERIRPWRWSMDI